MTTRVTSPRRNRAATPARQSMPFRMPLVFTLDWWREGGWYLGQLREVPDVFSQGRTLQELRANIREAYELMLEQRPLRADRRRRRPPRLTV